MDARMEPGLAKHIANAVLSFWPKTVFSKVPLCALQLPKKYQAGRSIFHSPLIVSPVLSEVIPTPFLGQASLGESKRNNIGVRLRVCILAPF